LRAQGEQQERQRQQRIKKLEKQPEADGISKELVRLRQGQGGWESAGSERREQIRKLSSELAELEAKVQKAQPVESSLEHLIKENMVRLDMEKQRLMESLRVIARNVFYQALEPFKKACHNYRDDHDQFRQLTQASEVWPLATEQIVVHLMPRVNYPPLLRRILGAVLEGSTPSNRFCLTAAGAF